MRVLCIGEVLWDVFGDTESLGGAALNVCANLHRCGDEAVLLSAIGDDPRGNAILQRMRALGLPTHLVQTAANLPTGTANVSHDIHGEPSFVIERPAAFDAIELTPHTLAAIQTLQPDWIYMGTLLQTDPAMEGLVSSLLEGTPGASCFYDMNLRTGHWNLPLVEHLCRSASILKLNEIEAKTLANLTDADPCAYSLDSFCEAWGRRFEIEVICVTLGPDGCLIYSKEGPQRFPAYPVQVNDTVGAGDAFAAAFLHGYDRRWPIAKCADFANALGALVASYPGATPEWTKDEVSSLAPLSRIVPRDMV